MNKPGQVLTELVIALSVVIIGVMALVQLATKSISNAGYSKHQSVSTSYGSSATDWVRKQRDTLGWDAFASKAGQTYCINNLAWTTGSCGTGQIGTTGFSREVTLSSLPPDKLEAVITVKWTEGIKPYSSKQSTIFGRYTQKSLSQSAPTPTPTPVSSQPISFDAFSSAATNPDSATLSWTHTAGAGCSNRILIVGVGNRSNRSVSGITYNSVALTKIRSDAPGGDVHSELWYLTNPATGSNQITITMAASTTVTAGATTWCNTNQSGTPFNVMTGNGATGSNTTNPSVSVTSAVGEVVVDVVTRQAAGGGLTVGPGQVQRFNQGGTANATAGSSEAAAAGSTTMSWTMASESWAMSAASLKPLNPVPLNQAASSTITASSVYSANYAANKVADGIIGLWDVGEWASAGQINPWIRLTWAAPKVISSINIYDRVNPTDWAKDMTITFSDASTISVTAIPNDGTIKTVTVSPSKTTTYINFQVVNGSGSNVGLSEIQAMGY